LDVDLEVDLVPSEATEKILREKEEQYRIEQEKEQAAIEAQQVGSSFIT